MAEDTVERRLTTILAADVVGYSRLMAANAAGTLTSLEAIRRELIEPKTTEHPGRVVKPIGDGTLMEFGRRANESNRERLQWGIRTQWRPWNWNKSSGNENQR